MWLVLPGRRRGRGLRALAKPLAPALAALAAVAISACGGGDEPRTPPPPTSTGTAELAPLPRGLAIGLDEENPALLWTPAARGQLPAGFGPPRDSLLALRPSLYRLDVAWSKVQPDRDAPPDWARPDAGCLRDVPPCAPYEGMRDQLRALRSQLQAGRSFDVLVVFFGAPAWATRRTEGCVAKGAGPDAYALSEQGQVAYRRLAESLIGLAAAEHVPLRYWSPWNEPNQPAFIAPQRTECAVGAPALSPQIYAERARQLKAALDEAPGEQELVLGETAGYEEPRPTAVGAAELARALPKDVVCAGRIWDQHAYVGTAGAGEREAELGADPVRHGAGRLLADLVRALDEHGCPERKRIWITETGVGGPKPGGPRPADEASLRAGCRAMHEALRAWHRNPRVDLAVQYTFREDDRFPVGLVDTGLTRAYPTLDLWRAWSARPRPTDPPPVLPASCR